MKLRTWMGLAAGVVAYFVLATAAWLTPLRVPLLEFAGRDFAVLRHQAERHRIEQAQHPRDPERVEALRETEARMSAWRRSKERTTLLGFAGWVVDLWPWLAFLGLALPAAGALIAAQGGRPSGSASSARAPSPLRRPQASSPEADAAPPPPPMPSAPVVEPVPTPPPPSPPPAREDSRSPPAPVDPSRPSASPADWNWSVRPAPRPPRPPKPFVEREDPGLLDPGSRS